MKLEAPEALEALSEEEIERHADRVAARWREIDAGKLVRVVDTINAQSKPIKARHTIRVNAVMNNSKMSTGAKIDVLWQSVDELGKVAAPYVACRKGCSHCCYLSVLISAPEAALIGKRIGVKPVTVEGITEPGDIKPGYDNPCPFLKRGECSIYEARPLVCRKHFNVDTDALLCELVGDEASTVPYLNFRDYENALAMITIKRDNVMARDPNTGKPVPATVETSPAVGDIREFFPKGKR